MVVYPLFPLLRASLFFSLSVPLLASPCFFSVFMYFVNATRTHRDKVTLALIACVYFHIIVYFVSYTTISTLFVFPLRSCFSVNCYFDLIKEKCTLFLFSASCYTCRSVRCSIFALPLFPFLFKFRSIFFLSFFFEAKHLALNRI